MSKKAGPSSKSTSLQEQKAIAFAQKGIFLALLSGIIFSWDAIILTRADHFAPFNDPKLWLLMPVLCAGIHDLSSAVVATTFNWRTGRFKEIWRSLLSKPGRAVILGAFFGALFGMGGYMAAVRFAGPAYILPITSLYPAVASVLAMFILKEKIGPLSWSGIILCIIGASVIGFTTPPEGSTGTLFYIGMGCALLAAIGWAAEGVFATAGMDFIDPNVALNIYYIVSSSLYIFIIIPVMSLLVLPEAGGIAVLGGVLSSKGLFFIILAGCIGSFSYFCWYSAMNMTGVSRAMALNISYSLWGILFSFLFTDVVITRNLLVGALVIFIGMFLVIGNPKKMMDLRNVN